MASLVMTECSTGTARLRQSCLFIEVLPGLSLLSYTEKKYLAQNQKSRQRGQDDEAVNGATSPSHSERFGETLEERDGGFESGALMRTARGIKTS